jgi:hypothetical protein
MTTAFREIQGQTVFPVYFSRTGEDRKISYAVDRDRLIPFFVDEPKGRIADLEAFNPSTGKVATISDEYPPALRWI